MFVYSLIRRIISKNFLKNYKRSSKIENKNKNNSNGNDEMMVMNQMIWSKLTRQIQEFQWIYLQDTLENGNLRCKTFIRGIFNSCRGKDLTVMRIWMKIQLVDLWDKSNMNVMNSLSLQKIESVDEVYELLSQERSRLQELYVKCAKI
ncbi:hypothetical protein Glove_139g354 [Diversispora epigaea]|uniref:Uncharacterized protein n=1 Tax=Diversispora epigaea TaxID=1348612 RepID=A0A397J283_9GLOM|nr:hypothetical protein Glove_139g354 [Diversispora epigaea]